IGEGQGARCGGRKGGGCDHHRPIIPAGGRQLARGGEDSQAWQAAEIFQPPAKAAHGGAAHTSAAQVVVLWRRWRGFAATVHAGKAHGWVFSNLWVRVLRWQLAAAIY